MHAARTDGRRALRAAPGALRARIEDNIAAHGLAYPWWVPLTSTLGQLTCVVIALFLRDAVWPPEALVLTAVMDVPAAGAPARRPGAGWWLLGALVLTPALILGCAAAVEFVKLHGAEDAAGDQQIDAISFTEDEVRELHTQRWDALQTELIGLRGSIAEDGWDPAFSQVPGISRYEDPPSMYAIELEWSVSVPANTPGATREAFVKEFAADGWTLDADPVGTVSGTTTDGAHVQVDIYAPDSRTGDVKIRIRAESAKYWTERVPVAWVSISWEGNDPLDFRYDEWPKLRAAG